MVKVVTEYPLFTYWSGNLNRVARELLGSCQGVAKKLPGSCSGVARELLGSCYIHIFLFSVGGNRYNSSIGGWMSQFLNIHSTPMNCLSEH